MSPRVRALGVLAISVWMIFLALPSLVPESLRASVPWLPEPGVQLGLDLRGGMHWLASVDHVQTWQRSLETIAAEHLERAARWSMAKGPELHVCGASPAQLRDLEGDRRLELRAPVDGCAHFALRRREQEVALARMADRALEVIRRRSQVLVEPILARQGSDRILVELPGVDPRRAEGIIGRPTFLELKRVIAAAPDEGELQRHFPGGFPDQTAVVAVERGGEVLLVPAQPLLTGDALADARLDHGRLGEPLVTFVWNDAGAGIFRSFTREHIGERMAAIIDGVAITAPVIRAEIGRSGQIEGRFTREEAADLALRLRAGSLPVDLHIEEQRSIGPNLGADAIRSGVLATLFGGSCVLVLTALYYGCWGLLADLGLALNLVIVLACMDQFHATLTLPGLAGLALGIGMAVDSNIIVFERIREELRAGRTLWSAVQTGFERSFLTILDANLTTLIAGAVLYWIGRGPIRGLGLTLAIGIGATLFCAVTVTRLLMELALRRGQKAPREVALIPAHTRFDFVGRSRLCSMISLTLVTASLLGWLTFGLNLGIDFRGGSQLQITVPAAAGAVDEGRLRGAFAHTRLGAVDVTSLGSPEAREFLVRFPIVADDQQRTLVADLKSELSRELGAAVEFDGIDVVGPRVGREIVWSAVAAVAVTSLLILAYVGLRFDWTYAPGAVAALLHDVCITIGVFAWLGIEFDQNIVAALIVILGYSVNDTVVIYDRVRENTARAPGRPLADVVNESLNETLSRTLLTTGFTLSAVLALLMLGGPVLRGLSIALLVGMLSGVYSTVYVASALLVGLRRRFG